MNTRRVVEYDILKCIGIVMVVMGHTRSGDLVHHSVYYVHMALFFLLAGCTNRKDDYYSKWTNLKEFFVKRMKSLYCPFVKYSIPIILFHIFFYQQGWYNLKYSFYDYVVQIGRTLMLSIGMSEPLLHQLWFIKVLFIAEILYALLLFILHKGNINKYYVIIPVGLVAFLMNYKQLPHFCNMNFIIPARALLLYTIGGELWRVTNDKRVAFTSLGGVFLWLYVSTLFEETSIIETYGLAGILTIPFSISVFIFGWQLCKYIMKTNVYAVINYIGRNTMSIYFLHYVAFRVITISYLFFIGADTAYTGNSVAEIPWWFYVFLSITLCLLFNEFLSWIKKVVISIR